MDLIDRDRFSWIFNGIDFDKVNDWEMLFIESCEKQLKFKPELSEKQSEIMERIYREKGK